MPPPLKKFIRYKIKTRNPPGPWMLHQDRLNFPAIGLTNFPFQGTTTAIYIIGVMSFKLFAFQQVSKVDRQALTTAPLVVVPQSLGLWVLQDICL